MRDLAKMCLTAIIGLLAVIICCIVCSSCRSVQYVPVESVRTEIDYRDRMQRDSIHVRDSIFMYAKGDTIFRDRWHTEYKDRLIRDTTYINKTDTIRVPYIVEKETTKWQRFSHRFTIVILIIIGMSIILFIRRKIKR